MSIIDKPSDYFNTKLYSGTGSELALTGVGFAPNWIWIKHRNEANPHKIFDTVRGVGKSLKSNSTDVEASNEENGYVSAFGSDGFTLVGGSTSSNDVNKSSGSYVAWNWKAETSFTNDASGTGIGSIDSAGSFNNDSGFSIVSYTGTGSAGTIKHGLNSKPQVIFVKARTGDTNWGTYHEILGNTKFMRLNQTNAAETEATFWNSTTATSSVFSVGSNIVTNWNTKTMIAYCFAEKKGYSKFSSYVGNGSNDGVFCFTGMKPSFVMRKKSSGVENWTIHDNKRDTHNVTFKRLLANDSGAEYTSASNQVDLLSNGFKCRASNDGSNASGETYIYMAFAENPFVSSTGVPATAR